ncbi:MAG TPA: stage II sporulation protein R [Candidatus Anaerostipes avistercoris]|uniref:Stage II sporulation protein R n=1 Tax=Candidatus Anaerostipes avistercoris TaxID=2838462 RepID=A0A9D2PGP7_9FIRM|nr:stage II sporulation protein R [Candidatus Anaerostipes avistercoris]
MKTKYIRRTVVLAAAVIIALAAVRMRISASVQEDLREQVLRFHVRANSDSAEDQREKLMVRDAVIDYVSPYMEQAETKEEAAEILKEKKEEIRRIAAGVLERQGNPRKVEVSFTTESFPEREYGGYTFPAGIYDAVRVDLGEAGGHNWWCVMFPDLCMTKDEKEKISREAEEKMKKLLGKETVKAIQNSRHFSWLLTF